MSSTVACIGFTDPAALTDLARDEGQSAHELSSTTRWVDSSGAMLLLDRGASSARPSFDTPVRTTYRGITPLENGLAQVTLTDVSGFELDPFTVVPNHRYTVGWAPAGSVALVAMGVDTEFFATAEDFFDSPRSALPGHEGEPPAEVKQFGLPWPPPMEIETFLPDAGTESALATLSGTVQFAEVRTNSVTGHEFLVSRIATVCGEIDLLTPLPLDGVPTPGSVTVGQVELLAGFPPFGVEDTSAPYEAPAERVGPALRDDAPDAPIEVAPLSEIEMPEGLVLGDDGVVRTKDEHAAWKRGEDEPDDASTTAAPAPAAAPVMPEQPVEDAPAHAASPAAADTSTTDAAPIDDSAPRPGETRREWRARTGR